MKRIVYNQGAGVAVVVPCISLDDPAGFTEAQALARAYSAVPAGAVATELEASAVPTSRTFRDAWRLVAGALAVDMPAARLIHAERIRQRAAPLIAAADAAWITAEQEHDNAAKTAARARKLLLIAAPSSPLIAAAATPAALEAVDPLAALPPFP